MQYYGTYIYIYSVIYISVCLPCTIYNKNNTTQRRRPIILAQTRQRRSQTTKKINTNSPPSRVYFCHLRRGTSISGRGRKIRIGQRMKGDERLRRFGIIEQCAIDRETERERESNASFTSKPRSDCYFASPFIISRVASRRPRDCKCNIGSGGR